MMRAKEGFLLIGLPLKDNNIDSFWFRGCLKKIDKTALSIVLGVVSLSASEKSGDLEQNLVWLGLNSQF